MLRLLDRIGRRIIALTAVFLAGIATLIWVVTHHGTGLPPLPAPPQITVEDRQKLFNDHVLPNIGELQKENHEAGERAIKHIDDQFARYRAGVPRFAEDLGSISTRLGVLLRMPADWWYKNTEVQKFVAEKFERHLFGAKQFNDDLAKVLADFRGELEANRNRFLSRVRTSLSTSQMPEIKTPDLPSYSKQVEQILVQFSSERATDSVQNAFVALLASEAATIAAEQIVAVLMSSVVVDLGGIAGGATVEGVATGGAAGILGGPVGAAIGIGVGLVLGIAVDWYLTDRFEAKVIEDLKNFLTKLRDELIEGSPQKAGFRKSLDAFSRDLSNAEESAIHSAIVGS